MDLTPKQQTSEAIRQAESILIITGQNPTIDQVAAVMSLASVLRKFGKKVSALVSDPTPKQLSFAEPVILDKKLTGLRDFILKVNTSKSEVDKLRYEAEGDHLSIFITPSKGGFAPSDVTFDFGDFQYDIVIVLGVSSHTRIDKTYLDNINILRNIPLLNIDYHRNNESFGAVNLIESTASSLCEILVATSESLQSGLIDADIATVMLCGLMASTDRFTAPHTTSKSLTVAAQLMAAGAKQQTVVKALYKTPEKDNRPTNSANGAKDAQSRRDNQPYRPSNQSASSQNSNEMQPRVQPSAEQTVEQRPKSGAIQQESAPAPKVFMTNPEPKISQDVDSAHDKDDLQTIGPVPRTPNDSHLPIIDPAHIELEQAPESSFDPNMEVADFAAAAEVLQQRLNRELPNTSV